jgi:hypothetical protein
MPPTGTVSGRVVVVVLGRTGRVVVEEAVVGRVVELVEVVEGVVVLWEPPLPHAAASRRMAVNPTTRRIPSG